MRLFVCCLVGLSSHWSYAATDVTIGDLRYDLNETTNEATVKGLSSSEITNLIIPEKVYYFENDYSVTSIGDFAFSECSNLTSLTLPNSIISISDYAFKGCNSLTSLTLPNSVTSIGESAFSGCSGLTSLVIPNSVTQIKSNAFKDCCNIEKLVIEDGKTELILGENYHSYYYYDGTREGIFYDCPLEEVYLGRDLSYDEHYSPFSNTSLKSLTIGNSVTSIGESAFLNCSRLKSIFFGMSVQTIGSSAFEGCRGLIELNLGKSVYWIGRSAFKECTGITSVKFPNSVSSIQPFTFWGCSGIKELTIPNSIWSISDYAFAFCTSLTSLTVGESVGSIGDHAFHGCSDLKSMTLPKSVYSIGSGAFYGCSALTSLILPNSITRINSSSFEGCSGLTSLIIPNSVTLIGNYAFAGCSGISSLNIGNSVNYIGESAFRGCKGLSELNFPPSVNLIGTSSFYGCSKLKKVILPASLPSVGSDAFGKCPAITQVYSLNTEPPFSWTSTFDSEVEENATLHVRKGAMVHYWLDPVWKEFKNMNDDLLCLEAIPAATYGDGEIDLSQYAPEGVNLRYETSNSDVVEINGNMMRIVGAGEATVGALLDDETGLPMELMGGQMRQFMVDKADLEISVAEITIEEGEPLPEFYYLAEGLKYDDTLDDIEELPQPICDVDEYSPVGEYPIYFSEGHDRNYNIATKPSKVIIAIPSGIDSADEGMIDSESDVEVYNLDGMLVYKGLRKEAQLEKGVYIVRQGKVIVKIMVK